jgi:hypothetical protein
MCAQKGKFDRRFPNGRISRLDAGFNPAWPIAAGGGKCGLNLLEMREDPSLNARRNCREGDLPNATVPSGAFLMNSFHIPRTNGINLQTRVRHVETRGPLGENRAQSARARGATKRN